MNCSKKCSNFDHTNCSGKRQHHRKCECICHKINESDFTFTNKQGHTHPLVFAINVSQYSCKFWCKHCKYWHSHGKDEIGTVGHRLAHCGEDSPYRDGGYFVKIVKSFEELDMEEV